MRTLMLGLLFVFGALCHAQAQIEVLRLGTVIADGGTDNITYTGTSPFNINYGVRNDGSAALSLTGVPPVEITATANCNVVVLVAPPGSVAAGTTETFTLQVSPVSATTFSFSVSLEHDVSATPYVWTFVGNPAAAPGGSGGGRSSGGCSTSDAPGWLWLALLGLVAHRLCTRRDRPHGVD